MPTSFDTVITGAGISRGGASPLPSGDELAVIAWLALFDPDLERPLFTSCDAVRPMLTAQDSGLRLEHLIEVLSRSIPLDVLVDVYQLMGAGRPNETHAALAGLDPHDHFTLNVDTLLEDAGMPAARLTHLHGRWDRPQTITTTVSQYLDQLPVALWERFIRAVEGRDVLVVGYSGRDFDVFPLLQRHPPRRIRWLVHPGGSPLEDEVRWGLQLLQRDHSCDVDTTPATIFEHLGQPDPPAAADPVIDPYRLAAKTRRAYGRASLSARALGAARVMFEIGALGAIEELAQQHPCEGTDLIWLRKMRARAERRRGHHLAALRLLSTPPRTPAQFHVWRHNGNEIANLISHAGLPIMGSTMDRAMLALNAGREGERQRTLSLTLRVRLGQRASVVGRLHRARELLQGVADDPVVTRALGPAGAADAITWLLDALKGTGDYAEALDLLPRLQALLPYTNLSQRAYALWQTGAVQLLCGNVGDAVANVELAHVVALRSGDPQATAWVRATLSDALRGIDSPRAGRILDEALADPPADYLAHQFLLTQAAEHARHLGDLDRARTQAAAARAIRVPGRIGPRRSSMNYLATRMIDVHVSAEIARGTDWTQRAIALQRSYERRGAHAAVADLQTLLNACDVADVDTSGYRARGWTEQAERAEHPWDWRRPWRVIA